MFVQVSVHRCEQCTQCGCSCIPKFPTQLLFLQYGEPGNKGEEREWGSIKLARGRRAGRTTVTLMSLLHHTSR